ncbi:protein-disulfide reductase DsbD family protein [Pelagibius marinus]|uniref:protein-disulfide reductase DsbD family protein n=1 Tax=Pelagibius marinus TaxID=2762760 RepID=UPI001D037C78|nr:protein-disulfide reductase DsbD domain-containing protein [Pelagibius marinus]
MKNRTFAAALLAGFLAFGGALALAPQNGVAAASGWAEEEQGRLRLISAQQSLAGEAVDLGLEFDLQPGWKIYWRSPGDAGLPPRADWSGSENLKQAEIAWPVPHRFSLFGLETFGYGDQIVLPVRALAERPGEPLQLRAKVDYLLCEEICIPYTAELSLDLPAGEGARTPQAFLIESFRGQVPGLGAERGLGITNVTLTGSLEAPRLQVTARSERPFQAPDLLVEGPPGFTFGVPEVSLSDGGKQARLSVAATTVLPDKVLEGKAVTVTVTDGPRGIEKDAVAQFLTPPAPPAPSLAAFAGLLGLALLGGLILNLMPCVLPVLSIKLLSVVQQGGRERGAVRLSFLASAAGVIFSFLVLASLAVALKATGLAVGWGIQFQQPLFLSALALVMTLFAYNLLGFFEVPLPGFVGRLAATGTGHEDHSLLGNFATGALATLMATPCSAPFLGTSVGFALARGALEIYLIFTALGLGLALPYLLVAAAPRLVAWLPRPGHWMVTLRRVLGLLLAATAVWLLSVLAAQVGALAALLTGGLLLGLGLVLWKGPKLMAQNRFATSALAVVLALAAFALPAGLKSDLPGGPGPRQTAANDLAWRPLDAAAIPGLVAEGRVVFVDVTADWCITCQVNKKLVLNSDSVAALLSDPSVVRMRGDWTLPSDAISSYLASFGRYGIPFNAVYGPGAPEGLALPELLSQDAVTAAFGQVRRAETAARVPQTLE